MIYIISGDEKDAKYVGLVLYTFDDKLLKVNKQKLLESIYKGKEITEAEYEKWLEVQKSPEKYGYGAGLFGLGLIDSTTAKEFAKMQDKDMVARLANKPVTRRQFFVALRTETKHNKASFIEAANTLGADQGEYAEEATEFRKANETMQEILKSLKLTDKKIDAVFAAAIAHKD